ncbi:hypothetical protein [Streptacidiphilus anmyonensis]|uniref:hypothetical protein n=1 Tax=Streptacidiphilus anmyonensis TaxID=405782 RepID=UPI0006938713|nr:hypothetical protein [Streptacidiphilus anmyonensis]
MRSTARRATLATAAVTSVLLLGACGPATGSATASSGTVTASSAASASATASTPAAVAGTTAASPTSTPTSPTRTASATAAAAPASVPVLGTVWASGVQGYGVARPAGLDNHGDPTGIVSSLKWSTWGGASADGTGTAEYVAPGQSVAQGTAEQAVVVAFDLGTCHGRAAYRAIEWYFPGKGQHFDPAHYFDACTGQDHGM